MSEIFHSIQGESTWAGLPCVFVRTAGCNLRCRYCDTQYASTETGTPMALDEIVARCAAHATGLAEITGGEPLLQEQCPELAARLLAAGYTVLVETNGSLPIRRLPPGVIRIMDIKCPASGMSDSMDWSNIDALEPPDEVKFVLADRADYEWCRDTIHNRELAFRCNALLLSPVFGVLEPRTLAQWILEDALPVRFQLQLHKYVWAPDARGV